MYVCIYIYVYVYGTPPRARFVMCSIMPQSIAPEYRRTFTSQSQIEASRGFGLWKLQLLGDVTLTVSTCASSMVLDLEKEILEPWLLLLGVVFQYQFLLKP